MKSRAQTARTRRRGPASKRKLIRRSVASRRAPVIERAHLTCLLCGRKGDVEVPVGTFLAGAPHELICADCLTHHPSADHDHLANGGQRGGFKIIGRDGDSARVLVVPAVWDPADRRRGLAPAWIFDTKLKKGWGPLPLLAATRSGAWREWTPDDKEMRTWLAGFAAVRKDLRAPAPEQDPPRVPPPPPAASPAARRTRKATSKPKAR